jgi:alpha-L-rhamnosidase
VPRRLKSIKHPAVLQQARWIWPGLGFHHLHNGFARFRKVVTLDAVPRKALAFVSADQCYRLRVNGCTVCRGPARGYQLSWPHDEVDLAPFLRQGRNVISIRAYNAGHSTFGYRSEGFAGLIFAARLGRQTIVSDASWKCIREAGTRRDTVPYSLQLPAHQESIDLRIESPEWETVSFDDSGWGTSEECRRWNAAPYADLEARDIPLMREFQLQPEVIGTGAGSSATGWQTATDLAALRLLENLAHAPSPAHQPSFRLPATRPGEFRSILLDFGRVVVGSVRVAVKSAAGGETLDFLHTEALDTAGLKPLMDANDHSRVRLANRLVCRAGRQSHTFFHHLGFRYLVITGRNIRKPLDLTVDLEACGYPLDGPGTFRSSDPELNKIWEACAHTQRICSLDAYVDTPWREQAQWWGDARIQAWNTYHLSGDPRLLRRGIRILAGQPTTDGLTYGHAPTMAHSCILPDFALIWILTLWDDYWQTGETVMLERHHDRVSSILDYFRRHTNEKTGLINYDPRYWLFLDWTDIQKDGQPALLSLWLLQALQKLRMLLQASSLPDDFEDVPAWERRLTSSIRRHLLDRDGLVCDGLTARGKRSRKKSLQAQTLAWMCNLPGLNRRKALDDILLPWVREDRVTHAPPSSYWCAYPLDLLARQGFGEEVVLFIKRRWQQMAEFGSCFENFEARPADGDMLSHSHAWSAHPLYLLMQTLGGIRQTAPAWREISFKPVTVGSFAEAIVPTPRGVIKARWEKQTDNSRPAIRLTKPDSIRLA